MGQVNKLTIDLSQIKNPPSPSENPPSLNKRQQKKHETGFEPATLALARRYSTTEPLVHIVLIIMFFKAINTILYGTYFVNTKTESI